MNKVDRKFTIHISDSIRDDGVYIGTLLTSEEIDSLFDYDEEVNPNFHTELAEAMIERSTGIKVDLSTQGPANYNITRVHETTIEHQDHNVYTVIDSGYKERVYLSDHPDTKNVPKITPMDANVSTTSIDFAANRPRPTLIDGMRLDGKENPIETCFLNQLTVIQMLKEWGADVTSLIRFSEVQWGVNYIAQLIDEISLAPIKDMELFLASGGRPPPCIYISPNFMSRYTIAGKPTVTAESIGVGNIFRGRSAAIAKLVTATCNLIRGIGTMSRGSFNMNAGQFSVFDSRDFASANLNHTCTPSVCGMAYTIVGISSFDEFVSARQSMKTAHKYVRMGVSGIIDQVSAAIRPSAISSKDVFRHAGAVMDTALYSNRKSHSIVEETAPSKITALMFSMFHMDDKSKCIQAFCSIESVFMILSCGGESKAKLSKAWPIISRMHGMCELLGSIPFSRVQAVKEINDLLVVSKNAKMTANIYMLSRTLSLASANMNTAFIFLESVLRSGKLPTALKGVQELYLRDVPRILRMFEKIASTMLRIRPYSYAKAIKTGYASKVGNLSILDTQISKVVSSARDLDSWESFTSNKKVSAEAADRARTRHLFANLRKEWSAHYDKRLSVYVDSVKLTVAIYPDTKWPGVKPKGTEERSSLVLHGIAVEFCVLLARSLAYKYCKVDININLDECETANILHQTVQLYKDALLALDINQLHKMVVVDMRATQWEANSYLTQAMTARLHELTSTCSELADCHNQLQKVVKMEYNSSADRVKSSIMEAILRDYHALNDEAKIIPVHPPEIVVANNAVPLFDMNQILANAFASEHDILSANQKSWNNLRSNLIDSAVVIDDRLPSAAALLNMVAIQEVAPVEVMVHHKEKYNKLCRVIADLSVADDDDVVYMYENMCQSYLIEFAAILGISNPSSSSVMA